MPKPIPHVTQAEWDVMELFWSRPAPLLANDVVAALADRRDWNPRTVKTLLNRLVKKKALGYQADGKRYLYRPLVRRDQCVRHESRSFLSRVFADRPGEMLCRFIDEVELTPDEIQRLKDLLDRKAR